MDMVYIPRVPGPSSSVPQKRFYRIENRSNHWLWKYRYPGGIYGTYLEDFDDTFEILFWIKENIESEIKIKQMVNFFELRFKTKEAFMAYKLRWL